MRKKLFNGCTCTLYPEWPRPPDKNAYWKTIFFVSFEHPKHIFKLMSKNIIAILHYNICLTGRMGVFARMLSLASLHICAGSHEPSLPDNAMNNSIDHLDSKLGRCYRMIWFRTLVLVNPKGNKTMQIITNDTTKIIRIHSGHLW